MYYNANFSGVFIVHSFQAGYSFLAAVVCFFRLLHVTPSVYCLFNFVDSDRPNFLTCLKTPVFIA
jgi:hypothetical protein